MMSILLTSLLVCGATATCFTLSERQEYLNDLLTDLSDAGYGTVQADFKFFNVTQCAALPSCFLQNPTSPYGYLQVPANPFEPIHDYTPPLLDTNSSYRLNSSEAVIIVGCTPPTSRYFGFTPYVTQHYRANLVTLPEAQRWINIFGSMSDTINQATVKTFPDGPFSANAIFILTGSQSTFDALAPIIAARFGTNESQVNVLPLPAGSPINLQMGLGTYSDLFSFLFRQAIPESASDYATWQDSTPFSVLRVYDLIPPTTNVLYGTPVLRTRVNPNANETYLQPAFNDFVNETTVRLAGRYDVTSIPYNGNLLGFTSADWGGVCYVAVLPCSGDNRDATYLTSNATNFFNNPSDQYLVLGANSYEIGTAVYSNVVDYNYVRAVGLTDVIDTQYNGSANQLVPDFSHPSNPNDQPIAPQPYFFQWLYAYNCQPLDTQCQTVASSGYPSIAPSTPAFFMTRAYQASATLAGPTEASLIKPVVLYLVDRCRPQACDTNAGGCNGTAGYVEYNIAVFSKSVNQSSTFDGFVATNAVDGKSDLLDPPAVTNLQLEPYWEIDLTFSRFIDNIGIKSVLGSKNTYVLLSNSTFTSASLQEAKEQASKVVHIIKHFEHTVSIGAPARYVRIQKPLFEILTLTEVQVNAYCLTALLTDAAWTKPKTRSRPTLAFLPVAMTTELSHIGFFGNIGMLLWAYRLYTFLEPKDWKNLVPLAVGSLLHLTSAYTDFLLLQANYKGAAAFDRALAAANIKNSVRETLDSRWHWYPMYLLFPFFQLSAEISVFKNIPYSDDHTDPNQQLDVYKKQSLSTNAPVVIYIHGGSWTMGDKANGTFSLWNQLVKRGFIVVSINYRLAPKNKLRQQVIDCKKALSWVRYTGCDRFGGDPKKIAVCGESAGGTLALLLALTPNDPVLQPGFESSDTSVIACIDLYGSHDPSDFDGLRKPRNYAVHAAWFRNAIMGEDDFDNTAMLVKLNPLLALRNSTSANVPPIFSAHGVNDSLVFIEDARLFVEELGKLRDKSNTPRKTEDVYVELPKAPHAFNMLPSPRALVSAVAIEAYLSHVLAHL